MPFLNLEATNRASCYAHPTQHMPSTRHEVANKIFRLQEKRDNIIYLLAHEELPDADTLQLEAQLSAVEDAIVLLSVSKAA